MNEVETNQKTSQVSLQLRQHISPLVPIQRQRRRLFKSLVGTVSSVKPDGYSLFR